MPKCRFNERWHSNKQINELNQTKNEKNNFKQKLKKLSVFREWMALMHGCKTLHNNTSFPHHHNIVPMCMCIYCFKRERTIAISTVFLFNCSTIANNGVQSEFFFYANWKIMFAKLINSGLQSFFSLTQYFLFWGFFTCFFWFNVSRVHLNKKKRFLILSHLLLNDFKISRFCFNLRLNAMNLEIRNELEVQLIAEIEK